MRTKIVKIYEFDELSDESKERAIADYREKGADWIWPHHADDVIVDAKHALSLMGYTISNVWYSGFYSQGDGACFDATYCYKRGWKKDLQKYVGGSDFALLAEIGNELQTIQARYFYSLHAKIEHSGYYYHDGCTNIYHENRNTQWYDAPKPEDHHAMVILHRKLMKWIYRSLKAEYEYITSDAYISEHLQDGALPFTEDGDIWKN